MIFITTGSQKFQFDRLIKKVDELIEEGVIQDRVFAQLGCCSYRPKNMEYCEFLDRDNFQKKMDECSMVITHGGTGVIITAVKKGKKVIAVPRLAKYGEHVDDHQVQLLTQFDEMSLICSCYDIEDLGRCYAETLNKEFLQYNSNTQTIIDDIENYLGIGEKNIISKKKETQKRIEYLDAAKGIAIFLVCVGHAITNHENVNEVNLPYLLRFINQFHMPLFFVINGMLFSEKYVQKPIGSSLHKFKAYYVPFVVYNLIFLALHNVFAALKLVNAEFNGAAYSLKQYIYRFVMVITGHRQSFGGAMWFLGSLLIMSLLFIWSKFFIEKIVSPKWQEACTAIFILACVLVGLSPLCPSALKLDVSLYSMLFFYFGYLYKKYQWNDILVKRKGVIISICLLINIVIAYISPVGVVSKGYSSFPLFAVAAITGSLMVIMAVQYRPIERNTVLKIMGQKSLDIMSLHFLCFKIVSVIIILVYGFSWDRLAEYPVLREVGGAWWLLYAVVGATFSVIIRKLYDLLVGRLKSKG